MNRSILIPRRTRRNPGWMRSLARRIAHYRYFRQHGYSIKAAWFKSALVIN